MRSYHTRNTILLALLITLSLPLTAMAEGKLRHRPPVSHHRQHASPQRHHWQQHHHKPHQDFRFGISVGSHFGAHHHGHGHRPHRPVVVERYVYYYAVPAPVWHVYHQAHHFPGHQTSIHIIITADHNEVYVDGQYVGHGRLAHDGRLRVPVTPGEHIVQVRMGDNNFMRQVHVPSGNTAVIEARLQR